MLDTMMVADNLQEAGLNQKQAEAVATVVYMARRTNGENFDAEKAAEIFREAGFDEAKARALVCAQEEACRAMRESLRPKSLHTPKMPWYRRIWT